MSGLCLLSLVLLFAVTNAAYCPDGYCRHSTNCYLVVGLNATFIEARAYCEMLGGHLLKISSQANQDTAVGVMKRSEALTFPGNYWLDTTDLLNPGEFKWMSDKTVLSYTNWGPGYPREQNTTENCVGMKKTDLYQWSTVSCSEKNNFVCFAAGQPFQSYGRYRQKDIETVYCLPELSVAG